MTWFKAKLLLLSISVVWLFFIAVMAPLQIPVTIAAIKFKQLRKYRYNLWISQDQLVNAIHGGNPDVTVSSRIGFMALKGSKTAAAMARVVDLLFYIAIGQEDHFFSSIEWDEERS